MLLLEEFFYLIECPETTYRLIDESEVVLTARQIVSPAIDLIELMYFNLVLC